MKPPKLFIRTILLCLLCMSMGFPNRITQFHRCQAHNQLDAEGQQVNELPFSNSSTQQQNSYPTTTDNEPLDSFSSNSKPQLMSPYPQWALTMYQAMHTLTQDNYAYAALKMSQLGMTFPFWILLQSLLIVPTPSLAQIKAQDRTWQAAIYIAQENPFLLYVRLNNPQRRMVYIKLSTKDNNILFADWTNQDTYNTKLNLSDLANGEFWVQVTDQQKVIKKEVSIHTLYEQKTKRIVSLSDREGY